MDYDLDDQGFDAEALCQGARASSKMNPSSSNIGEDLAYVMQNAVMEDETTSKVPSYNLSSFEDSSDSDDSAGSESDDEESSDEEGSDKEVQIVSIKKKEPTTVADPIVIIDDEEEEEMDTTSKPESSRPTNVVENKSSEVQFQVEIRIKEEKDDSKVVSKDEKPSKEIANDEKPAVSSNTSNDEIKKEVKTHNKDQKQLPEETDPNTNSVALGLLMGDKTSREDTTGIDDIMATLKAVIDEVAKDNSKESATLLIPNDLDIKKEDPEYVSSDDDNEYDERETLRSIIQQETQVTNAIPKVRDEVTPQELEEVDEPDVVLGEDTSIMPIGKVVGVVEKMLVIQGDDCAPALDEESALFLDKNTFIGKIFDTFGNVKRPHYSVRIPKKLDLDRCKPGCVVFCAPFDQKITHYIFVAQLKKLKGSDASWKNDHEPPPQHIDYSDDEEERNAKKERKKANEKRRREQDNASGNETDRDASAAKLPAKGPNKNAKRSRQQSFSSARQSPGPSPQQSPSRNGQNVGPHSYGLQRQNSGGNMQNTHRNNTERPNPSNVNPYKEGSRAVDTFGRDQPRQMVQPRYQQQVNVHFDKQFNDRDAYRNPEPPFNGNMQRSQFGGMSPRPGHSGQPYPPPQSPNNLVGPPSQPGPGHSVPPGPPFPPPSQSPNHLGRPPPSQSPMHSGGFPQQQSPYNGYPPPMPEGSPGADRPPTPPMPPLPMQPPSPFQQNTQAPETMQMPDMSPKSFYGSYGPPSPFLPNRVPRPFLPHGTRSATRHQQHQPRPGPPAMQQQGSNQWTGQHGGSQHGAAQQGGAQYGGAQQGGAQHQQDPRVHGHFQQHAPQRGPFNAGHRSDVRQSPGTAPWTDDQHQNSPHPPNWSPLSSSSGDYSVDYNSGFGPMAKESPPPPPPPPMSAQMPQSQEYHNFHPQDPRVRPRHNILPPPMIPGPSYSNENFSPRGQAPPMNMNSSPMHQDPRVRPQYPNDPRMRPQGPYGS